MMPSHLLRTVAACALVAVGSGARQVLHAQSTPVSEAIQISQSGRGAYEVSLAAGESGLVAAWYDTRNGNAEIYARAVDIRGRPTGPELRLTDNPERSYEADVELLGDDIVVAWYDRAATGRLRARVGRWTADGTRRWAHPLSEHEGSTRNPLVLVMGETLFCAWLQEEGPGRWAVWVGWLDPSGQRVTAPQRVATAGDRTWNLNATLDDDGWAWVVFDAAVDTRREELFLVRVSRDGRHVVRLTEDDGFASKYPDLVLAGETAALTWFDERDGNEEIYLFAAASDQLAAGIDAGLHRVTHSSGESVGAYLGWNGQQVGLAWSDDHDGQGEIYFQAFEPDGSPLAAPRRLTDNTTASRIPAIEPIGDGFALVWNEDVIAERSLSHGTGGRSEIVFLRVE
ncbi:MAG: hypothetical protein QF681_16315 [Vicinamibacterales bacterium]|jgi:hypothetical protein|nr:hypothetical protein [Vicinamibacterales bacterium]